MEPFIEISKELPCPCGSGEKHDDCCKNKSFRFGTKDGELVKRVPMDEEVTKELKEWGKAFFEYYGRYPGENDFVAWDMPIYNDDILLKGTHYFRELGFPENKIYAYYKSDGLLLSDINTDLLSQNEIEEFQVLCKEYDELLNEEIEGHMNSVQYVIISNSYINEQVEYVLEAMISSLNDLIRRHSGTNSIREYKITTEIDYCIFSALKTVRTLESIGKLRGAHLPECIYALSRGIFENYMYICNINVDSTLFKDKILPKVDEVNYTFGLYADGRINYNKVTNKKSEVETNIKIIISDLKKNLPHDADKELYTMFYQDVCQYVHVDVMSAKSYFSVYDPYDEIDPSLIASLITIIIAMLLLFQMSNNKGIQTQYRDDILYLCKNLSIRLVRCLEIARSDEEHTNDIFDLLLERLREQL